MGDRKLLGWRAVILMAGIFWFVCSFLALHRYFNFFPTFVAFDQGIFNQVFWNSLHGRWFESSLSSTESSVVQLDGAVPEVFYRRLGQHFTPSLLLWLPVYALLQSPAGLSLLQVTLMALGGLMLYKLARIYHPPRLAGMFALSYFCANAVLAPTVANFHDFSQVPLFVFGLLLAMEKRHWWKFWVLAGLTLLVREDAGVILFGVGFYMAVSRRFLQMGLLLCSASLGYMLLLTNIVMPLFSDDISRRFMVEQFGQFVDNQEASTLEVLLAILRNPIQLLEELVNPPDRTIRYLLAQWVPLAFVPVISVDAWLLAGFPTLKILMQHDPVALSMHLRYAVTLVPGLFYGAILWWAKHPQRFQPRTARIWLICIGIALFFTIASNPNRSLSFVIPDSVRPWVYISPSQQWQHAQAVRSLLRQIPPDASVTAPPQIINHLSSRREALRFPGTELVNDAQQIIQVEYAVVDLWYPLRFSPAFNGEGRALINLQAQVKEWLDQKAYGLIDFQDGVALLQLGKPSNPTAIANLEAFQANL